MTRWAALLFLAAFLAAGCGGGGNGDGGDGAAAEGDPARGKEIYLTSGCGACHTFTAAGTSRNVGPNLDEAAKMYPPEFLRESIVDPKAYIEKGTSGSIGGDETYGTAMPAYGPEEIAQQKLSEQQIADLVAFLTTGGG
jgi:mono/diheme cytochrome c family protein